MANERAHPLNVSYCTTCKGRLHHLKQTLPKNLAAEKDNPNVEFVLLSYGRDAEMDAWIKENFQQEIHSGRLKYVVYPEAQTFKFAHAKNMAHRMASGDILVNLDADNMLVKDYSVWLKQTFARDPHAIVTHLPVTVAGYLKQRVNHHLVNRIMGKQGLSSGYGGRIAIGREDFYAIQGFDENLYHGWGPDDWNMVVRARRAGGTRVPHPETLYGDVIDHSNEVRMENLSAEDRNEAAIRLAEVNNSLMARMIKKLGNLRRGIVMLQDKNLSAGTDGNVGCGTVYVNFSEEPTIIAPLYTASKEENVFPHRKAQDLAVNGKWALRELHGKHRRGWEMQ